MDATERGERLLDLIYDEVDAELNPDGDECWYCGGEGETHDCFDGFCVDAEDGCEDCRRPCPECRRLKRARLRVVRVAVVEADDVDVTAAWLKSIGRWTDDMTPERLQAELASARSALAAERVLARWAGKGPRNVLIRREDGELVVRPLRELRRLG